ALAQRWAWRLSWLVGDVLRFRRRTIEENLLAIYPHLTKSELSRLTRASWYHLIQTAFQVVHISRKIHDTNWREYVWIRDRRQMTERLIDYRPLVVVTGHFGNFEMGGYVMGLLGMPSYAVARTLDNPYLDRFLNEFRSLRGQHLLPKDGSAQQIQHVLDEGGMLGVLADQHAGTKGCWIEFLGRPAACHKAVALFTLTGMAPMMVSYCKQLDEPLRFEIGCCGIADPLTLPPELRDVTALTQWYNDRLAEAIHADPAQYWWVHRRWKERPTRGGARGRVAA
ncbi:MAG TPA: lysophospholipid acyltransferase family protein, partial [Pirellulaceae bacterium]|nr:lysophospholipid acyltransferase family protein [Pirellulaceae bacterium]